ncbi:Zot-like ATPase [Pseudomonas phage PMBT54]|nr:Zot-like ATPase [Pseudomonas phage PMBT54]
MPIHAYVGKPGHGKSYGVVERVVIPSLKQNRHVVTNIPLNADDLLADFGGNITQLPEDWFDLEDMAELFPPGCVAILDEVWRRWPRGQRSNMANKLDQSLLAEHRHKVDARNNSMRIVLVTQDLQQLANWACLLIETTFRVVKLSKKVYRVDVYNGSVTGDKPSQKNLIRQYPGKFSSDIHRYYSSATQSSTGEVGDESVADKSGSILRSWGLWSLVGIFIICLTFGLYGVSSFFSSSPKSPVKPESSTNPVVTAKVEKQQSKPVPSVVFSSEWRLAGLVHPAQPKPDSDSASFAVIVNRSGITRYIPFDQCSYYEGFKDAFCDLDGQRITKWSSSNSTFLNPTEEVFGSGSAQRSVSRPTSEPPMIR